MAVTIAKEVIGQNCKVISLRKKKRGRGAQKKRKNLIFLRHHIPRSEIASKG